MILRILRRRCVICGKKKPNRSNIWDFSQDTPTKLHDVCCRCEHAEERAEQQRDYREANKARLAEQQRDYREANKARLAEYQRDYYQANKERLAEQQRDYREANKERLAEQKRDYYQANKERLAEYQRDYYQANKERLAEQKRDYYQAKLRRKITGIKTVRSLAEQAHVLRERYADRSVAEALGIQSDVPPLRALAALEAGE